MILTYKKNKKENINNEVNKNEKIEHYNDFNEWNYKVILMEINTNKLILVIKTIKEILGIWLVKAK